MTNDPQMVERVSFEIDQAYASLLAGDDPLCRVARSQRAAEAALEASHHAELVEALKKAEQDLITAQREFIRLNEPEGHQHCMNARCAVSTALAKIGGGQ